MTTENGLQQDAISRPEVSEASATLRFPSFVKMDVLETHGASMFQKRRTRALIRGKKGPVRHVKNSGEAKFPLDEKAHFRLDVLEAVQFVSANDSNSLQFSCENQIGVLKEKAKRRRKATQEWEKFRETELPLLAYMMNEVGMGGQSWATQFTSGSQKTGR